MTRDEKKVIIGRNQRVFGFPDRSDKQYSEIAIKSHDVTKDSKEDPICEYERRMVKENLSYSLFPILASRSTCILANSAARACMVLSLLISVTI